MLLTCSGDDVLIITDEKILALAENISPPYVEPPKGAYPWYTPPKPPRSHTTRSVDERLLTICLNGRFRPSPLTGTAAIQWMAYADRANAADASVARDADAKCIELDWAYKVAIDEPASESFEALPRGSHSACTPTAFWCTLLTVACALCVV